MNVNLPFFDSTVADGVTHFTIYNHMFMPTSYGDPDAEYRRLLEKVAMWDVAVQRQVQISGDDAERLVRYLIPRDLKDCPVGRGMYVPLCDHYGRLINDPILLRLAKDKFWLSIADSDVLLWVQAVAAEGDFDVSVEEPDVSPLAIQGPNAEAVAVDLLGEWVRELKYFQFRETTLDNIPLIAGRSGWSKQGGFEIYLRDGSRGAELWDRVKEIGAPYEIGPGAPNQIERLESGLLSYGADNLPDSDPFEVGLGRLISLDRTDNFIGKTALHCKAEQGPKRKLVGIIINDEPILPNEHPGLRMSMGNPPARFAQPAIHPGGRRTLALHFLPYSILILERNWRLRVMAVSNPVRLFPCRWSHPEHQFPRAAKEYFSLILCY